MSKTRVRSKIKRKVKRELKHMSKLKGDHGVKVGLPLGSNDYPDTGESVINVGFWHEFGTTMGLPERAWMRNAIRDNRKAYKTLIRKGLLAIQQAKATTKEVLGKLGLLGKNHLQASINSIPLVDTGHLKDSQTWEVLS